MRARSLSETIAACGLPFLVTTMRSPAILARAKTSAISLLNSTTEHSDFLGMVASYASLDQCQSKMYRTVSQDTLCNGHEQHLDQVTMIDEEPRWHAAHGW